MVPVTVMVIQMPVVVVAQLDHLAVIMPVVLLQRMMNGVYVVVMVLQMVPVTVMVM